MENQSNDYIEIEYSSGSSIKFPEKIYSDAVPDTMVSNEPVELQEVYFSSQGKGYRNSYNYRLTISIDLNTNLHFLSPLKSKMHKHDYFELILIASDRFEMQIESQLCEFNKWDVCILNRSTHHSEHFNPDMKIFYFVLSPEYLLNWPQEEGMSMQHSLVLTKFFGKGVRDTFQQNKDYIAFRYTNQVPIPPLHNIAMDLRGEFKDKEPGYQLLIRGLLYRLFSILANSEHYETEYINLGSDVDFSLAYSTKLILDENKKRITKHQLAERLNYNSEHINRAFKKHYGYTIPEYNRLICMRQAAQMLCNTDQHIHEICKQLGFVNRTHFYSLFEQEYSCLPTDYRKKNAKRK